MLLKQGKELAVGAVVHAGFGQLEAAAAQEAGRRALEQLDIHLVGQNGVQVHDLAFQHTFDAVLHPVHMGGAAGLGGLIDAGQAGVDDGGRPAGLPYQYIFHNIYLLYFV